MAKQSNFPEEITILMARSDGTYEPCVPICSDLTWSSLRDGKKLIGCGILAVEITEGLHWPETLVFNFSGVPDLTKAELLKEVVQKYADNVFEGRSCISADTYDAFQTRAFYGLERDGDIYRPIMGANPSMIPCK